MSCVKNQYENISGREPRPEHSGYFQELGCREASAGERLRTIYPFVSFKFYIE